MDVTILISTAQITLSNGRHYNIFDTRAALWTKYFELLDVKDVGVYHNFLGENFGHTNAV